KIRMHNICHQAILFKHTVFKKIGNFDLKFKTWADWDHNLRWFLSKKIEKRYVNIIFANYADGGFSSCNDDHIFGRERTLNFLINAGTRLGFRRKVSLIMSELPQISKAEKLRFLKKVVLHIPKIFFAR